MAECSLELIYRFAVERRKILEEPDILIKLLTALTLLPVASLPCIFVFVFVKAPSFEAREAHRYYNNRLCIFRARGGGLLDHP